VVSSVALVATLPILLVAAVAIKLDSPGPVISRHSRVGRDGAPFELLRLRSTAYVAKGQRCRTAERLSVAEPAAAVTRVGRILRGTSIDELPQFWNVLRGDLTLVGPPPEPPSEVSSESSVGSSGRIRLVPGITGTWGAAGVPRADGHGGRQVDRHQVDGSRSSDQDGPDSRVG
jgi:lipopolysaccharide/colanic/teichoic acid biosynthesis glycosyltransferase